MLYRRSLGYIYHNSYFFNTFKFKYFLVYLWIKVNKVKSMKPKKRKTTISIDEELWREWLNFVVQKTGSGRKVSNEVEHALREYMEKHKSRGET